ncbi:hypothetical protein WICMUC_005619 [Wickerhamomyces mucosus]|uniref:mRNA decay factor PAT1 domain-containing protein n=1 Tax=Wickerhamomyces mucosus TaxID=1378264 RepID=A0A9P8P7P9_9ASCO|nr:hypothetical protein WICMUC_005619 [Wickerhamomyces mucosus]
MSFNKFKKNKNEVLNFEDTYAGYDDEEEDAFNDETFGNDIPVGQDFNFGGSNESGQTELPKINYAEAAKIKPVNINISDDPLKPLESLWGEAAPSIQNQQQIDQGNSKPLSLDELEAQLTNSNPLTSNVQPQQTQQLQNQPPPGVYPQQPNFGYYPPGFIPPPPFPFNGIPSNFNLNQIHPQQFAQLPPQLQQQLIQQHQQNQLQQIHHQQNQQQQNQNQNEQQNQNQNEQQQQQQQQQQNQQNSNGLQEHSVQQSQNLKQTSDLKHNEKDLKQHQQQFQQQPRKQDLSQFPVLGSDEAKGLKAVIDQSHHQQQDQLHQSHQSQHHQQQHHQHHQHQQQQQQRQFNALNNQNPNHHHQENRQFNNRRYHHHHDGFNDLPEEEKQRLIRRQHKVQRILQFSGIMTPRDKDYVTRIQLSHIVTEDPYNEDFYFQVFRLIKSGDHNVNNNSIAQAYLDFSGHKLGGRHQRADLALQRMQQQVQRAVTVAKERPRTGQVVKEGALGRISFSSGKKPRKQLNLITQRPELPELSKVGKKAILLQIEDIYQQTLNLESDERENKELSTDNLWESLKLFDNSQQLNPFIQVLSYEKGLKLFPRIFHFLNRQQKLTIVTLIFANLSLIKIISKSSFKTHENEIIPAETQKTIDLFQLVVIKPIILFLSYEAVLTEIIGLLTILVEHNNVSFLSTSKLGVSLLTIVLSRAEIIRQEQAISTEDSQHWQSAYDKLFSSLETKLSLLFPKSSGQKFDDSYIWQFLASLALSGKLNHQRIIVDEIRDEIFGSVKKSKDSEPEEKFKILNNLNLFLNVIGLNAKEDEIVELK